ncbi:MAG: hypothetical protein JW820_04745 [Spirochaetales bacterium]|nr:hypothetical protein [Spirochaetales bacterium]
MGDAELPDDPSVAEMIGWIAGRYQMTKADLARMFQTTQSTIHYWVRTGRISYRNLRKLRSSYYYLHNTRDPHAEERKCQECGQWRPLARFRDGKAICRECENTKTLRHYWQNRENELERRKAKNWYNQAAR